MKITRRWLEDWVKLPKQDRVFARHLTEGGLEVEAIETLAAPFSGIYVARLEKVTPHPTLGHLSICELTTGREQAKVISGAPDLRPGLRVPWAKVGARLAGLATINIRWFDGIGSQGMLCSEAELSLGPQADRILELPDGFPEGASLAEVLGWPDVRYEINLTPNRGDCLSALGLAREISAIEHESLKKAPMQWARDLPPGPSIRLTAQDACPGLLTLTFEIVDQRVETPLWMRSRLVNIGFAPVHPVVDVTQYVMMELGQPTHAYDLDQLRGDQIEVRWGRGGEMLRLLNDTEISLDETVLVVSDAHQAIGAAGLMGGKESAVHAGSRRFLIESAHFRPQAIAGRARRLNLASEAAVRFERGVDPELPPRALERIAGLLSDLFGRGIRFLAVSQAGRFEGNQVPIPFSRSLCTDMLGLNIQTSTIQKNLTALGCQVQVTPTGLEVTPPSFRFDLTQPVDLVEEVARLVGYEKLPEHALEGAIRQLPVPFSRKTERQWASRLVNRGYQETVHMSFADPLLDRDFSWSTTVPVALQNPLAQNQSILRRSLWPSLVETLRYNLAREQKRVRIFEMGPVFGLSQGQTIEQKAIAGLWHGSYREEEWGWGMRTVDFFDVKGDIESMLEGVSGELQFEPCDAPMLDPTESAHILLRGQPFGIMGAVHPELQKRWDIRAKTYLWSLNMIDLDSFSKVEYKPVAKFPAVRRDFAFILPESVPFRAIAQALLDGGQPLLQDVILFDVYSGPPLEAGSRSLAFGLLFRDQDSTLTEKIVNDLCEQLVLTVEGRFRGRLRK